MKFTKILAFFLCILVIASCKKEEFILNNDNYLAFGHFYGLCGGEECVELFVLTDENLFEVTNDQYAVQDPFELEELTQTKFLAVEDLPNFFPSELLNSNEEVFGCPDCADQGGLYIEYKDDNGIQSWTIDQRKDDIPSYLHDFVDKVNEKIQTINM